MNLKNFPKKLDSKTSSLRIKVPENLDLALEGLIRKVLREQPKTDEIYSFSADYFEALLKIRERAGIKYAAGQICPFHNDEDAHEMFKLANAFPKPHATEVDSSSNERNKKVLGSKDAQKEASIEESSGKIIEDERISNSGTIIGGPTKESSPGKKETNEEAKLKICEPSKELKVEGDKKEFSSSDPIKELVEKELLERKAGSSAAENNEVVLPGKEGGEKEPEENLQRFEGHDALTCDLSVARVVHAGKGKETGDRDKNSERKNEVDKIKETEVPRVIINETFDKKEEVVGYFEKIREQEETEKVKGKERDKQSAKGDEEEKTSWKKTTIKDKEDVQGGAKTERKGAESSDILENAENEDEMSGSQENKTRSDVKAEKETKTKESNAVADKVKEIEEREVEKNGYENKEEAAEKLEEDEAKILEETSTGEKQRDINESKEEVTSEEKRKKLQNKGIHVRGFWDEINLPTADEHGMKIEQQPGEEIVEIERTKESRRTSFEERTEKGRKETSEAAGQVRGHSSEGGGAVDEGVNPESEKLKEEVETNGMGKQEARLKLVIDKKENDLARNQRKEELVEKKENVGFDTQEMKAFKEQKFSPDQEISRAKTHNLEYKELEEKTKSLEEQVERETKNQNQPGKESKELNRNLSENENIKQKRVEAAENGNAERNSETEREAAKSEHERKQGTEVGEEEGITMEARQPNPKNGEPLPTTTGNIENPEDKKVLSTNRKNKRNPKYDEALSTTKGIRIIQKEENPKDEEALLPTKGNEENPKNEEVLPTAEENEENPKDDEALPIIKGNEENPKDDEALPTTKGNEENSKDDEALPTTKVNEENAKDDEVLPTTKVNEENPKDEEALLPTKGNEENPKNEEALRTAGENEENPKDDEALPTIKGNEKNPKDDEALPTTKGNEENPKDDEALPTTEGNEENPKDEEVLPTTKVNEENPKDEEVLPTTKGNEENPKNEEVLSTTKGNEENPKDDEALPTTKGNEENPKDEEVLPTTKVNEENPKDDKVLPTTKGNEENPKDDEVLPTTKVNEENPKDDKVLPTTKGNEENPKDDEALPTTKVNEENPKDEEVLPTTKGNEENPKDEEALPTTKGNEENPKNEETKEIERSENAQMEDYEKLKAGKIPQGMSALDLNVTVKEAPVIERNALVLGGEGVAIDTEIREAMAVERQAKIEPRKNSTYDENSKNEKIEEGLREVDVREESAPESKSESGGHEKKIKVKVMAEAEIEGQSEGEAKRERKEERAGEAEEEMCTVVDKINVVRIEQAEETEAEAPYERQLKTIETHYYDLLQVPDIVTSTFQMGRAKENAALGFDGKIKAPAVLSDKIINAIADNSFNLSESATCPSSLVSATENFLNNEKQYNSKDISHTTFETEEGESRKSGEMQESKEEVEDVILKTKAPAGTGAVPSAPRDLEKINEESAAAQENIKGKEEEEKDKGASSEDSHGATSSESIDGDATFISVEVRTLVESQVLDEEEKGDQREESTPEMDLKVEATIECVPDTDVSASDRTDVEKESYKKATPEPAADDEGKRSSSKPIEETTDRGSLTKSEPPSSRADTGKIKRPDSGKKSFTRSITQSLLTSQSLDSGRRKSLVRTRSLSSFRPGITDVEVWTAIEKELEKAATKIQSQFRGYKARKKLLREDAVQITTEESSNSSPTETDSFLPRSSGEFHDTIVLPIHPR